MRKQKCGYPVEEAFTRHELYVADECFLTGTAAEIIPIIVDGRQIGNGKPGAITGFNRPLPRLTGTTGEPVYPEQ